MNLDTKQGVLRFCELRRREMVGCFERLGRYECHGQSFGAYVFATHALQVPTDPSRLDDYRPGRKLPQVEAQLVRLPRLITEMLPEEQHTLVFREVLQSFARVTRSVGTLIMTEMWHVRTQGKTVEEATEARSRLPNRLADAPERGERLLMQLEHVVAGRQVWCAEIQRDPTRVTPWEERTHHDAGGRLSNIVDWRS